MKKDILTALLLLVGIVISLAQVSIAIAQVQMREGKATAEMPPSPPEIKPEIKTVACQSDRDCLGIFCVQVIGMDTPMCENGRCICGPGREPWRRRLIENKTKINLCLEIRMKLRELIRQNASLEEILRLKEEYKDCFPQPLEVNKTEVISKIAATVQEINKEKVENLRELQEKLEKLQEAKLDLILVQDLTGKELAEKIKELNEERRQAIKEFVEKVHELNLERQEAIKELVVSKHVDIEGMKFNITKITVMVNNQTIEIYPGDNVTINVSGVLVKSKVHLKIKNNTLEDNETNETIKELPDKVQERLRVRERVRVREMALERTQRGLAYVVAAEKPGRLLGIIPVNLQLNYQISAENGETISVNKPWWSIFVFS